MDTMHVSARTMDKRAMDNQMIKRAYAMLSPVYDVIFDKIFHPGRVRAIDLMQIKPGDRILEVGVGTGLNLPLYPTQCSITGIDISEEMLQKARERAQERPRQEIELTVMDASSLQFPDSSFDHVIATYVISVVPDPVKTITEMQRVCKPGGNLVILNHFKSENPVIGWIEWLLAPMCTRIGFKTDLKLRPLLERTKLVPEQLLRVNLLNGWRLVRCVNPK
ncbi:MAG: methyltransferase domain-containing protein [Candidatus Methylomirabilota bacterium]